jgi:hypothetical protein
MLAIWLILSFEYLALLLKENVDKIVNCLSIPELALRV